MFSLRSRRRQPSVTTEPTWQDAMPGRKTKRSSNGRYVQLTEIDRSRAAAFNMPGGPERGAVRQRVRQKVESLQGAIDEGTGTALDREIESWVATWINVVLAEHADHRAILKSHLSQAEQWRDELVLRAKQAQDELVRLREAYAAACVRLAREHDPELTPPVDDEPDDDGMGDDDDASS
jgi:hypothetical protein